MTNSKLCLMFGVISALLMSLTHAENIASLPSIQLLADDDLRDEVVTTVTPFQEDQKVRQALQHQVIKKEQDTQNAALEQSSPALNIQPITPVPDMSHLSPLQQQYVLSVVAGLQSNDPSSGIFRMLEPLGIDLNTAIDAVKSGSVKMNSDLSRFKLMFGDKQVQAAFPSK